MSKSSFLNGKLLLAMPTMTDPRFEHSVIYVCSHDESGAMGIVLNQGFENLEFADLLDQLDIEVTDTVEDTTIHCGGPLEPGRGFVLHSADYVQETTMVVSETLALTATIDVLKAIAEGHGPQHHLLALGYAGWGGGQLEAEITQNSWLTSDADEEIIFYTEMDLKWSRAMARLGIDISMLSSEAGHA
ncbi:UPF0301 protein [Kordiimonas sediminis]|uniref:UPF0301 protein GCM10017044_26840 n=1 Tax=Kordiimonas sediminis TaxID=1735581 RepID=A0A919AYV0_9PROT|nr:YqgE/AlgH family protein [Kordiimonas sediminis]GHF30115.1 UPF0301 protein [Kordiimonas sediminis]